jgi:hypothetical protein
VSWAQAMRCMVLMLPISCMTWAFRMLPFLPWDSDKSCKNLVKGVADAVFGVLPNVSESFQPQFERLGIRFEMGC